MTATSGLAVATAEGITLEVLEGPMDGSLWSGSSPRVTIGRATGNTFPLPLDRSVSSRHAALTWDATQGRWIIEDLRSTNGTWMEGARLASPQVLADGTDFILGYAVLRFSIGATREGFTPTPETLRRDTSMLTRRLSPAAALGLGAAVMLASHEKRSYVTDRQLLIGLASLNPELIAGLAPAGLTPAFVSETLRRNEIWSGARSWIARHLRAVAMDESVLFFNEMLLTPRLVRLLQSANAEAGDSLIEPIHIVRAMLADGYNRPCDLLRQEGRIPSDILASTQVSAPHQETDPAGRTAVEESVLVGMSLSSGDLAVDSQARETARSIENLSALYHLASPEERAKVLRNALVGEVSRLTPANRSRFLGQLRAFFPVMPGARPDVAELVALRRRVSELEGLSASKVVPPPVPTSQGGWSRLLGEVSPPTEPGLAAARVVTEFALAAERFIAATAHNLTTRGNVTEAVSLPGFRTSLHKLLPRALEGQAGALDELKSYLSAVERWLVATTAAYHESPGIWFTSFWSKVSPAAIEASLSEASRKKVFRIEAVELWNHYKDLVRALSSELVSDEVLLVAGRRAFEQFDRLKERKGTS